MFRFYTPYIPCKNQKTFEFLMLFLGMEMKHWLEIG